ncbi:hypothetical protein ABBQ32_013159 [Trebouxia sp. C0010 RCD-2024]
MKLLKSLRKRMTERSFGSGSSSSRSGLKPSPALQAALDVVSEKLADNAKVIGYEFDRLRRSPESEYNPEELSAATANPDLNRYANVLPFDSTRVVLTGVPGEYINASLLTNKYGSTPAWSYIATQGPLARTSPQFWQMIFQQRSTVIVMLTRVREKQVEKCWQYFPLNLHEQMEFDTGQQIITVTVVAVKHLDSDICMRELIVRDSSSREGELQVFHYHYHRWPDFGIPSSPLPLRRLAHLLDESDSPHMGPPVVHCSAGIGRTGTFIAIDATLKRLRHLDAKDIKGAENAISMKRLISHMRKERIGMVQTVQQYVFIYQAIHDEIQQAFSGGSNDCEPGQISVSRSVSGSLSRASSCSQG